jgi:hypothetical protein
VNWIHLARLDTARFRKVVRIASVPEELSVSFLKDCSVELLDPSIMKPA